MLTLIFTGKGWLVPAVTFATSLISEIITRAITEDNSYYSEHGLPLSIALFLSGLILYLIILLTRKEVIDEYGKKSSEKEKWIKNSFFFINMQTWSILLILASLINIFIKGI